MQALRIAGAVMAMCLWTCVANAGGFCGNGEPDPGEECDDGNMVDGDGCSALCQIESGSGYDCTPALPGTPDLNLLTDGSFEQGNVANDWIIQHSLFGEVICGPSCGSGLANIASDENGNPTVGNYVLLAGGTFTEPSTGFAEHVPIQIPPEADTLLFHYGIGTRGGPGAACAGPDDGVRLLIDGVEIWSSLDELDSCVEVDLYRIVEIPLDDYHDGGMHTIRFEGVASAIGPNVDLTNIFLDQIRIYVTPEDALPPTPSVCTFVVCGDGQQPQFSAAGTEECDDGNTAAGDGCSLTCEVEQPNFICSDAEPANAVTGNDIENGSLESGSPNNPWAATGSQFEPVCSQALCGAALANSGAFYAWFGGSLTPNNQSLVQDVVISSTATTLDFELLIGICDSANDRISITIDGVEVYGLNCIDNFPVYTLQSADITAFADGNRHTVAFLGATVASNGGPSNFFIDDIRIHDNLPFAGVPSQCVELRPAATTPEQFEGGIPSGWTVINLGPNTADGWGTSDDGLCARYNWQGGPSGRNVTGGGGIAACADSDATGQIANDVGGSAVEMDTYLCSPAFDPSSVPDPHYSFLANYQSADNDAMDNNGTPADPDDDRDLDLLEVLIGTVAPDAQTVANYTPVANILDHLDTTLSLSAASARSIDLSDFAAQTQAYACFHYRGTYAWFAQIDNPALREGPEPGVDTDGDGVDDSLDNCTLAPNPTQLDTDGDGHGNYCDADFNDDCVVNAADLGIFRTLFFQPDNEADLNGDGIVAIVDLGILRTLFFQPVGPSAAGICIP